MKVIYEERVYDIISDFERLDISFTDFGKENLNTLCEIENLHVFQMLFRPEKFDSEPTKCLYEFVANNSLDHNQLNAMMDGLIEEFELLYKFYEYMYKYRTGIPDSIMYYEFYRLYLKNEVPWICRICNFRDYNDGRWNFWSCTSELIDLAHSLKKVCGIYFLYNEDKELIYIGQSVNLKNRIKTSIRERKAEYISYAEIPKLENMGKKELLDIYEQYYITIFRPKKNKYMEFGKIWSKGLPILEFSEIVKVNKY